MSKFDSLQTVLSILPKLAEYKNSIERRGLGGAWVYRAVDPQKDSAIYCANGVHGYRSLCPYYKGYYLGGIRGATVCDRVRVLLPGSVQQLYCDQSHTSCPLFVDEKMSEQPSSPPPTPGNPEVEYFE